MGETWRLPPYGKEVIPFTAATQGSVPRIVLALCLHLARSRLWGPEGRGCAGKNRQTNPPPPRAPRPPPEPPATGRERKRHRGGQPVPRVQGREAHDAGNTVQGTKVKAKSQADTRRQLATREEEQKTPCLRAHCPTPRNVTRTQLLRTVCDSAAGSAGSRARRKAPPQQPWHRALCLATCSHRARIVNAPSGGNNKVCREEQPDDPPPAPPPPFPPPPPPDPQRRVGRERRTWEASSPGCKSGIGRRGRRKMHRAPRAHGPKPSNVPHTRQQRTVQAHSRRCGRSGRLLSTRRHPPPPKKKGKRQGHTANSPESHHGHNHGHREGHHGRRSKQRSGTGATGRGVGGGGTGAETTLAIMLAGQWARMQRPHGRS